MYRIEVREVSKRYGRLRVLRKMQAEVHSGQVLVASEQWSAELDSGENPISKGDQVKVVKVDGLRLVVRASDPSKSAAVDADPG